VAASKPFGLLEGISHTFLGLSLLELRLSLIVPCSLEPPR